jgi:hypothetical protein
VKRLLSLTVAGVILTSNVLPIFAETDYNQKLPYMFKDPTWEKYSNGQSFSGMPPSAPGYSTGIYSMASANEVDYKENENQFYKSAAAYKSDGNIEVYYKANPASSVRLDTPSGAKVVSSNGGSAELKTDLPKTSVAAYNEATGLDQLILEPAQGQWLVTNGYYSRDSKLSIGPETSTNNGVVSTVISAGSLKEDPWGVMGASTPIKPEDFLMGLAKSFYGTIQSRPLYIQSTPFRLAKKVTWQVTRPQADDNGYCAGPTSTYQIGDWVVQDVSYIDPASASTSTPDCGQTKTVDRGEYIVHPDGYLNNVYQRYNKDQNSYVSPNVYELYFSKLLQKGILDTSTAFAERTQGSSWQGRKSTTDNFSFKMPFADAFYSEYHNYGQNGSGSYLYPAWAPELGAVYSNKDLKNYNWLSNMTDSSITISGGDKVLGRSYNIKGGNGVGVTEIQPLDSDGLYMDKSAVIMIDALRLIEKALRIEDGDMTNAEASLVAKKYGDKYLDTLNDADRKTISYLLAKGILNFENFQEFSNLYTTLNESFAYELLYRVANKGARLNFSKITLTDTSSTLGNLVKFSGTMLKPILSKLISTNSVTKSGTLTKDGSAPLTLMSDVIISNNTTQSGNDDGSITVKASIDDPLKYLYRGKPLVNLDSSGNPAISTTDSSTYQIYNQPLNGSNVLTNAADASAGSTGITEITKNAKTGRWDITFLVKGIDQDSASKFVKANLETKTFGISESVAQTGAYENGNVMVSGGVSDINSSLSVNNDIVVNKDYNLSSFTSSSTTIAGNTLLSSASSVNAGGQTFSSMDVISKISPTIATERIGTQTTVNLDIPQLEQKPLPVYSTSGQRIGETGIINENVTALTGSEKRLVQPIKAYNISLFNAADSLIVDRTFTYTVPTSNTSITKKVSGSVVISWKLNLPSKAEQSSLVGNLVTPYTNDNVRSSWIFTEPQNKDLLNMWNYNTGLNTAILKTFGGVGLQIKSGYFSPSIDILVDSLDSREVESDGTERSEDLTSTQIQEIRNNLAKEIGANLDSKWVTTYIGDSALANYTVPKPNSSSKHDLIEAARQKVKTETKTGITFDLPTLLVNREIPNGETVWSTLVFSSTANMPQLPTYLQAHSADSSFNINSIYTIQNGNYYYGYFETGGGDGGPPHLELPYVKNNFGNWLKNFDNSEYSLDESAGVIREQAGFYYPDQTGSLVTIDSSQWRVVADTPTAYKLISRNFIQTVYQDNDLFVLGNGTVAKQQVLGAVAGYAKSVFGIDRDKGIDEAQFISTGSFDFVPSSADIKVGAKFGAIQNGTLQPMVYSGGIDSNGNPIVKLEKTKISQGDTVSVPVFVTISKSVWSINQDKLVWQKKFSGADPSFYTKGTLIENIKEQLLSKESKNLVSADTVESGTLTIGPLTGTITKNQATFLVPFNSEMLQGSTINESAVLDAFNSRSDLTVVDGKIPYSAAQYLTDKDVGSYDATYKGYNNTLVRKKNKLYIADGTKLTEFVDASTVSNVSLTAGLMKGLKLLNMGSVSTENQYRVYSKQDVKPPEKVSPFSENGPPVVQVSNKLINDTATMFQRISSADKIMKGLEDYLNKIRVKNFWYFIFLLILGTAVLMSVTTLLSHVFAYAPLSANIFSKLLDVTGIDFLAIFSMGAVRINDENKWIKTVKTSAFLGIGPLVLFSLMQWFSLI